MSAVPARPDICGCCDRTKVSVFVGGKAGGVFVCMNCDRAACDTCGANVWDVRASVCPNCAAPLSAHLAVEDKRQGAADE